MFMMNMIMRLMSIMMMMFSANDDIGCDDDLEKHYNVNVEYYVDALHEKFDDCHDDEQMIVILMMIMMIVMFRSR